MGGYPPACILHVLQHERRRLCSEPMPVPSSQGSVETIARGHEASVRIAMQGHHAAAAAARLPVATLSQMLKSALSVELDTRQVSQRLMRLIKADRWHLKAEQILRSHAKPTGAAYTLELDLSLLMQMQRCVRLYCNKTLHVDWPSQCGMWPRFIYIGQAGMTAFASIASQLL